MGFAVLTAADAGRELRARGGDGAAVDYDLAGTFIGIAADAGARAARTGGGKRTRAADGHGRAGSDVQSRARFGDQRVAAVQNEVNVAALNAENLETGDGSVVQSDGRIVAGINGDETILGRAVDDVVAVTAYDPRVLNGADIVLDRDVAVANVQINSFRDVAGERAGSFIDLAGEISAVGALDRIFPVGEIEEQIRFAKVTVAGVGISVSGAVLGRREGVTVGMTG